MPKVLAGLLLGTVLIAADVFAAAGPLTVNQMIEKFAVANSKELKRVKTKDRKALFDVYQVRTLELLKATGLQAGSTVFSQLTPEMQAALTKLRDDILAIRNKNDDTQDLINDLANDLRTAANSGTPPTIESVQILLVAVQFALADGEISEKEKIIINEAAATVLATTGLTPQVVAEIQADVAAIVVASGITLNDLAQLKLDIETIIDLARK